MPLSMEVGLGPGYFVLDGDPAAPKRGRLLVSSSHVTSWLCDELAVWRVDCVTSWLNDFNETTNVMVTNGSGLGLKFFKIILFQHRTTSEMKQNCWSR